MVASLLALIVPLVLGVLAERVDAFGGVDAVGPLNGYALRFAFPALVVASWLDPSRPIAIDPVVAGLTLVGPVAGVATARLVGGERAGGAALLAIFGNSAYLGLPLVEALFGPRALASASLVVAIHVALSVTLGAWLAVAWTPSLAARRVPAGDGSVGAKLRRLAGLPLLWSPVVGVGLGLASRAVGIHDHPVVVSTFQALQAFGRTAGPVGIFVLGMFLARHRSLWAPRSLARAWPHVLARLVAAPGATLAIGVVAVRAQVLEPESLAILVTLSAVPAAISTFAMAHDAERAHGAPPGASDPMASALSMDVAGAIVATSLASLATMPLWAWLTDLVGH